MIYLGIVGAVDHELSHDASACIVVDNKIVAMAEEERFIRYKHAFGVFPKYAIEFCLKQAGVKITGVTVHFVTEDVDSGPNILQEKVSIENTDTEKTLEEKIHTVEHKIYPKAIKLFIEGKLKDEY